MKDTSRGASSNQIQDIKVLLVDDEPDLLEILTFVLEHCGAEVRSASSVTEALGVLSEFMPDVITTDIQLPDGDGCLLAAQVKEYIARRRGRSVPIIALSGYSEDIVQEMDVQSSFQAHLVKPVEIETIIHMISQVTQRKFALNP